MKRYLLFLILLMIPTVNALTSPTIWCEVFDGSAIGGIYNEFCYGANAIYPSNNKPLFVNGSINLTGNVNSSGFYDDGVLLTPDTNTQRKGDDVYLYNDSDTIYFNESKGNDSIDSRVDATFLQNLLDAIYASITFVNTRVDSINNHTATVDSNASTACSGTTTYLDGEGTCDDISGVYVQAGDWTTHDNYATGCTNQFVVTIDDTLTCASVDSADIGTVLLSDLTNDINAITNTSDGELGILNVTEQVYTNRINATNDNMTFGVNGGTLRIEFNGSHFTWIGEG